MAAAAAVADQEQATAQAPSLFVLFLSKNHQEPHQPVKYAGFPTCDCRLGKAEEVADPSDAPVNQRTSTDPDCTPSLEHPDHRIEDRTVREELPVHHQQ